jgi:hypothetical protein
MIAEARTTPQALAALDAFFAKEPSPWARDLADWNRDRRDRRGSVVRWRGRRAT